MDNQSPSPLAMPRLNLQITREASGVTPTEMAAMIGTSSSSYSKTETGEIACVKFSAEICHLLGVTWAELNLPEREYSEKIKFRAVATLMQRRSLIHQVINRSASQLDKPLNAREVKPEERKSTVKNYQQSLMPDPLARMTLWMDDQGRPVLERNGVAFIVKKEDCHLIGIALQAAGGGA